MTEIGIWISTDTVVYVQGLHDVVSKSYDNGATITAALADADGTAVTGATAINVAYVAASDGDYAGEVQNTVTLVEDAWYTITLTIAGTSYTTTMKLRRQAKYKEA